MLTLPIKKKWFDMIKSGEKKEEYREIKPYYDSRFFNEYKKNNHNLCFHVIFRNGYSKNSPSIKCYISLYKDLTGRPEWGAEPNKLYYVLKILSVEEVKQMADKELNSHDLARELEIVKLQEENERLNGAIQTYNILLKSNIKENQELKSQLRGTTHCFDEEEHNKLKEENQALKKQLENRYEKVGTLTGELLYEENTKLINQQKKFINYLEDEIEKATTNPYTKLSEYGMNRIHIYKEILQKYKSIIGGNKDEK